MIGRFAARPPPECEQFEVGDKLVLKGSYCYELDAGYANYLLAVRADEGRLALSVGVGADWGRLPRTGIAAARKHVARTVAPRLLLATSSALEFALDHDYGFAAVRSSPFAPEGPWKRSTSEAYPTYAHLSIDPGRLPLRDVVSVLVARLPPIVWVDRDLRPQKCATLSYTSLA
jgi:hypothetical protein